MNAIELGNLKYFLIALALAAAYYVIGFFFPVLFYPIGRRIVTILTLGRFRPPEHPEDLFRHMPRPVTYICILLGFFAVLGLILYLFSLVNN